MVFVTGATGFVGRSLIRKLLEAGKTVRALYRKEQPKFTPDPGLTWFRGEIGSEESLSRGMEGADAVVHLAGRLIESGDETFEAVHVGGTRNVLEGVRRARVHRLLHMSALGARPGAASRYYRTKWQAEEAVRAAPLNATIFRPSLSFGKEVVSLNRLAQIIAYSPLVPVLGGGEMRVQPVWVEDVADAFFRSLEETRSVGKGYALCGPRTYTLTELIDLILRLKKSRRLKLRIPLGLLKGPAFLAERLFSRPPLTRDQLSMLHEDNICSDNSAGEELGILFKGPEEILPAYL
jgi:uncharacterized protein YbjT (DUF2867 family)